jgi:hypothetical protein
MKDILFVTAQPDVPYFHWQCRLYIFNFLKIGISPEQVHILFSVFAENDPSEDAKSLRDIGVNIHFYVDDREDKSYIPSIKPYLIWKFTEEYPQFSKLIFLHDSDIVFRNLPNFSELLNDNKVYLSDTVSYIGYDYIKSCCEQYEKDHQHLQKGELLFKMTNIVNIPIEKLIHNQKSSGGGQYLIKNSTSSLWKKIYEDSTPLYKTMKEFHHKNPISGGIQFWTAEMWSTLWNLWLFEYKTEITNEFDFSWATDNIRVYEKKNILHMAGVTHDLKKRMFYKGDYININPIDKLSENENYFDYVDSSNSTSAYIKLMKDYIKNIEA